MKNLSRRGVIAATSACAILFESDPRAARPNCFPTACSSPAPTVVLNTGSRIPSLGFGTYLTNGEELFDALVHALRNGYRHIDTAAGYMNEPTVADAVQASGVPRDELFITTKLWCADHGRKRTERAIKQSLRALRTDYIDLYLVHAPDNQGSTPEEVARLRKESWQVLEEAHAAGTLRAIGVSNFEPRHIEALLREDVADSKPGRDLPRVAATGQATAPTLMAAAERPPYRRGAVVPAVNQIELHPHIDQQAVLEYCARKGITIEAYGAVGADGLLSDPAIRAVAKRYGRSEAQVSLRHTLQRKPGQIVLLAKSLTKGRIDENLRVFDWDIDPADARLLDALARKDGRSYWDNSDVP